MIDVFRDALFTPTDVSHHLLIPRRTVNNWLADDTPSGPLVHHVPPERRGAASVPYHSTAQYTRFTPTGTVRLSE